MKTRKRFPAHQSIHREITSHPSRGVHAQLLGRDELTILFGKDCDLPGPAAPKLSRTLIETVALVAENYRCPHRRHAHCGHRWHKKRHADFRPRDGRSICVCEFCAEDVAALMSRGRGRTPFVICLSTIHY